MKKAEGKKKINLLIYRKKSQQNAYINITWMLQ